LVCLFSFFFTYHTCIELLFNVNCIIDSDGICLFIRLNYYAVSLHLIKLLFFIDSEIDQLYKIYGILGMPDSSAFTIGANNSQLLDLVSHEIVCVHVAGVQSCTSCIIILFFFFIIFNPRFLCRFHL